MKIIQNKTKQGLSLSSKSSSKNFSRKKSSFFLLAAFTSSLISSQVFAKDELKFYGGVEAISQTTNFELRDNKSSFGYGSFSKRETSSTRISPAVFVGLDNGSNSRFELGFNRVRYSIHEQPYGYIQSSNNSSLTRSYRHNFSTLNFDYKPYLDLGKGFQIEGLLGLAYQKVKLNLTESYESNSSIYHNFNSSFASKTTNIISPSIGFGGRYEIAKGFFVRTQLRYTYLDKTILSTKLKSTTGISLGVGYSF